MGAPVPSFAVRGPTYFVDRKKHSYPSAVGELLVIDLFMSATDIQRVAESPAAGTVQRIRQAGEKRQLLILNFRIVPLHFVAVFAINPEGSGEAVSKNSSRLVHRFMTEMTDEERRHKLKLIPRVQRGPWLVRKALGENTPTLFAKNVPT